MIRKFLGAALAALTLLCVPAVHAQTAQPPFARVDGDFVASRYIWGYGQVKTTTQANVGASTITLSNPYVALADGSTLYPFAVDAPITIDQGSSISETVVPTAVSGCSSNAPNGTCTITATFVNAHGPSAVITSGTYGLQEAINDAAGLNYSPTIGVVLSGNGGLVVVDKSWPGTTTQILGTATGAAAGTSPQGNAVVLPNVAIIDKRAAAPVFYNPTPSAAAFIGTPIALVSGTTVTAVTGLGGLYTNTNAYVVCYALVDLMGNEGACSPTASITPTAASGNSIVFTTPPSSTGAIGYTLYISLTNGTYTLAYQVPITSSVCTMTTLETTTPACSLANATYGQLGSPATVNALTVNTAPLALQLAGVSTTSAYVGNSLAHTAYSYVSSTRLATPGIVTAQYTPSTAVTTAATTVPSDLGVIPIPAGFLNQAGKQIRICAKVIYIGNATSDTIVRLQLLWDGAGSDTAGAPVIVGNIYAAGSANTAAVWALNGCEIWTTSVAGSGVTAGSIFPDYSDITSYLASAPTTTQFSGGETAVAAVGSLNLAGTGGNTSRIHIVQVHTGGTDTVLQLLGYTLEAL